MVVSITRKKLLASYMRQEVNALIIELFSGTAHGTFVTSRDSSSPYLDVFGCITLTGTVKIGCCDVIAYGFYCGFSCSKILSTAIAKRMCFIYRFLPRLCYPVVIPGCRNTLRVAASAGAGVCSYSRIAAGRLRGHSANIAVGMGRLAGCARRTGAAGAGLAGRTIV